MRTLSAYLVHRPSPYSNDNGVSVLSRNDESQPVKKFSWLERRVSVTDTAAKSHR